MKRFATSAEIDQAPILPLMLSKSAHTSDTISWGTSPEVYGAADLLKFELKGSERTLEFERRLVAIYWLTGAPVPYLFRTSEGTLRSLDAGCLGYLAHRSTPDVELLESDGMIVAAVPRPQLLERYQVMRAKIEAMVIGS